MGLIPETPNMFVLSGYFSVRLRSTILPKTRLKGLHLSHEFDAVGSEGCLYARNNQSLIHNIIVRRITFQC